jgi:hypothetical protein
LGAPPNGLSSSDRNEFINWVFDWLAPAAGSPDN